MPNFSKIQILGHAGKDPELRTTQSKKDVASFSVAVKDSYNDETTWYEVSVFGNTATKYVMPYLNKGDVVMVSGTPSLNVYEKRDGSAGGSIRILAQDVQICTRKDETNSTAYREDTGANTRSEDLVEDEIPF